MSTVLKKRCDLCGFSDRNKLSELSVLFWPERVINYVVLLVTSTCRSSMTTSGISPVIIFFSGMSEVGLVLVLCYCAFGLDRNGKDEKSWALLCYLKGSMCITCWGGSGEKFCRERGAASPIICFTTFPFLPPSLSLSGLKKNSSFMD